MDSTFVNMVSALFTRFHDTLFSYYIELPTDYEGDSQMVIDSYKELLYYHAHNLIKGDEEKSKCMSLAKRAFVMVQEGAGGDIEDGLGADGLRCMHLGRPGAPVTVLEY